MMMRVEFTVNNGTVDCYNKVGVGEKSSYLLNEVDDEHWFAFERRKADLFAKTKPCDCGVGTA